MDREANLAREGIDRMTDFTPIRAMIDPTPANNPPRSLRAAVAEPSDFPDVMIHEWTVLTLHATATGREILARIGGSFRLADFSADWVGIAKRRPDR